MDSKLNEIMDNFTRFMKEGFEKIGDIKDENNFFYKSEILELVKYCDRNKSEIDAVLSQISKEFNTYNDLKANLLCHVCGVLVEFGGNQDIVISHVIEKMKETLIWIAGSIAKKEEEKDLHRRVKVYVSYQIIDYLITAAMTMLSRNSLEREKLKNDKDMPILLSIVTTDVVKNIYYIQKIMELTDNLEMTVIHPDKKKGYKIKVDGVQNYFHFFTLLQGEFIEKVSDELVLDKGLLNKTAVDVARAAVIPDSSEKAEDKAIFGYYIWSALSLDKTLSKNVPLEQWVYGELIPKHTPPILGERIILIGDNLLKERIWDRAYFSPLHDALKPQVSIISRLNEAEVEEYLDKIVLEKRKIEQASRNNESSKVIEKDEKVEMKIKVENNERGFKGFLKKLFN
ncbi:hypothetical protein [Clostridium coskatii]|uniref:Uncharacterized protein n=1 Tax=Clostridium coskatii TaxID=1705578 RepID=A0A168PBW7_9CLOT|nr:hypothetical protein [Clostridium coskatii]OAA87551.1 hypothetical protein WX73_02733 [Clostridium coskatii]OBR96451.1 hypothetical protein CLCOS_08890 [Clostridium coskatii]